MKVQHEEVSTIAQLFIKILHFKIVECSSNIKISVKVVLCSQNSLQKCIIVITFLFQKTEFWLSKTVGHWTTYLSNLNFYMWDSTTVVKFLAHGLKTIFFSSTFSKSLYSETYVIPIIIMVFKMNFMYILACFQLPVLKFRNRKY